MDKQQESYFVIDISDGDADIYVTVLNKNDMQKELNNEEGTRDQLKLEQNGFINLVDPGFPIGGKQIIIKGMQVFPKSVKEVTKWGID